MFKIAICEDEEIFVNQMDKMMRAYLKNKGMTENITYYNKGSLLLGSNHKEYDLIVLDVELGEEQDGIEIAEKLRKAGNKSFIIFTTSHKNEAYRGYEVGAVRYLIKPVQEVKLYEALDLIMKKNQEEAQNFIMIKVDRSNIKIKLKDIIYMETWDRKVRIHTIGGAYEIMGNLSQLEKEITEDLKNNSFYRAHRSYLVNMDHIREHNASTIIMNNGGIVYLSRLKGKEFKKNFMNYLKEMTKEG